MTCQHCTNSLTILATFPHDARTLLSRTCSTVTSAHVSSTFASRFARKERLSYDAGMTRRPIYAQSGVTQANSDHIISVSVYLCPFRFRVFLVLHLPLLLCECCYYRVAINSLRTVTNHAPPRTALYDWFGVSGSRVTDTLGSNGRTANTLGCLGTPASIKPQ